MGILDLSDIIPKLSRIFRYNIAILNIIVIRDSSGKDGDNGKKKRFIIYRRGKEVFPNFFAN